MITVLELSLFEVAVPLEFRAEAVKTTVPFASALKCQRMVPVSPGARLNEEVFWLKRREPPAWAEAAVPPRPLVAPVKLTAVSPV
jgi:hypothetical protein